MHGSLTSRRLVGTVRLLLTLAAVGIIAYVVDWDRFIEALLDTEASLLVLAYGRIVARPGAGARTVLQHQGRVGRRASIEERRLDLAAGRSGGTPWERLSCLPFGTRHNAGVSPIDPR